MTLLFTSKLPDKAKFPFIFRMSPCLEFWESCVGTVLCPKGFQGSNLIHPSFPYGRGHGDPYILAPCAVFKPVCGPWDTKAAHP